MLNLEEIRRKNLLTYKAERIYKMKKTRMLRTFSKGQSEYEEVVREYDLDKIIDVEIVLSIFFIILMLIAIGITIYLTVLMFKCNLNEELEIEYLPKWVKWIIGYRS